jgi:hypothetical protein
MGAVLLATLMLLSPNAPAWIRRAGNGLLLGALLRGATVTLPSRDYDETSGSIRPLALRLLGAFVALLRAAIVYPLFAPPAPMIIVPITIVSVLAYLYWVRRGRASVERLYPYRPPLNLLALCVFGSGNLRDFLDLSDAWQWLGTGLLAGRFGTSSIFLRVGSIVRSSTMQRKCAKRSTLLGSSGPQTSLSMNSMR